MSAGLVNVATEAGRAVGTIESFVQGAKSDLTDNAFLFSLLFRVELAPKPDRIIVSVDLGRLIDVFGD